MFSCPVKNRTITSPMHILMIQLLSSPTLFFSNILKHLDKKALNFFFVLPSIYKLFSCEITGPNKTLEYSYFMKLIMRVHYKMGIPAGDNKEDLEKLRTDFKKIGLEKNTKKEL